MWIKQTPEMGRNDAIIPVAAKANLEHDYQGKEKKVIKRQGKRRKRRRIKQSQTKKKDGSTKGRTDGQTRPLVEICCLIQKYPRVRHADR